MKKLLIKAVKGVLISVIIFTIAILTALFSNFINNISPVLCWAVAVILTLWIGFTTANKIWD